MADPVSFGMVGYTIQLLGDQILRPILVTIRCKEELDELKLLLLKIKPMNVELQEYQKALTTSPHPRPSPRAVKTWLEELNALLEEASDLALHCTVPSHSHLFSRYRMSRKMRQLTANVDKHLASTPLVALLQQLANQQVLQQVTVRVNSLNLCTPALASTSRDPSPSTSSATSNHKYIEEALIVGQDSAVSKLEELIDSEHHKNLSRFGLVGVKFKLKKYKQRQN